MAASYTNAPAVHAAVADVPSSSSFQPQPQPQLTSSAEIAATVQPAPSSAELSATAARLPENMMYKNRLQEFAQKSSIALPMYQTVNEGTPHAPRFRSTVWVNEKSYTTQITFSNRKAAEQDAARLALESLPNVIKDEASPLVSENILIFQNILFSKSILNEYATKLNKERPTYNTVQLQGLLHTCVSTLVFNGTKYTGDVSRNKKEAEQSAARRAILSILDEPNSGTLFEIVKSKSRISAAIKPPSVDASNVSEIANTGHSSVSLDRRDKEVAVSHSQTPVAFLGAPVLPNVSFPIASQQPIGDGSSSKKRRRNKYKANKKARLESPISAAIKPPSVDASNVSEIANTGHSSVSLDCRDKEVAVSHSQTPVAFLGAPVLPNVSFPIASQQPIGDGSSSKKRRRNKYKANKKARLESPLPVAAAFPVNAMPPCSVAQ